MTKNISDFNKKLCCFVCTLLCIFCIIPFAACEKDIKEPDTTYSIWLDIREDKICCTQSVSFVNKSEYILDNLVFNVYANAYDSSKPLPCTSQEEQDAYPNGVSFGKFELDNVYGDFKSYNFDSDKNLITIMLDKDLLPNQSTKIEFVYTLVPPNTNLRYGYNDICLSLTGFYPQLCALVDGEWFSREFSPIGDPYFSDTADYEVCFNLPDECQYVCSGLSDTEEKQGETFVYTKASDIRDFAIIISPVLDKTMTIHNGVEISYLGKSSEVVEYAKKALDTYSEIFGEYAYDSLALASIPFLAGGMEYGALCVLNDQLTGIDTESVTAHEVAHEWWYSALGSNNLIDAWQDEGLAEYSTYLYFEKNGRKDVADLLLNDAYVQYGNFKELGIKVGEPVTGMLAGELNSFASNYHYTNLTYNKAFILWDYASNCMGKDNLLKALRYYYLSNKFAIATPDDLYNALDNTKAGTSSMLKSWINNC